MADPLRERTEGRDAFGLRDEEHRAQGALLQ
jgi:hypothetical protein